MGTHLMKLHLWTVLVTHRLEFYFLCQSMYLATCIVDREKLCTLSLLPRHVITLFYTASYIIYTLTYFCNMMWSEHSFWNAGEIMIKMNKTLSALYCWCCIKRTKHLPREFLLMTSILRQYLIPETIILCVHWWKHTHLFSHLEVSQVSFNTFTSIP